RHQRSCYQYHLQRAALKEGQFRFIHGHDENRSDRSEPDSAWSHSGESQTWMFESPTRVRHSSFRSSIARRMSSTCGKTACSKGGLYGVGAKAPLSRRMGASSSSKPEAPIWAAISLAMLQGPNASSMMSSLPVFATEFRMMAVSSGDTVRGSMIST